MTEADILKALKMLTDAERQELDALLLATPFTGPDGKRWWWVRRDVTTESKSEGR